MTLLVNLMVPSTVPNSPFISTQSPEVSSVIEHGYPSSILAETVRAARGAFPKGNLYLTLRDALGDLYADQTFAALFARTGRPAESAGCLA